MYSERISLVFKLQVWCAWWMPNAAPWFTYVFRQIRSPKTDVTAVPVPANAVIPSNRTG
jgi:hypothetical protein